MTLAKFFVVLLVALILIARPDPIGAASSAHRSLNSTVPVVNLDNVPISDAIDFIRDVTNANIHVNWRALEGVGVGKDAQINIRLRNVSMKKVLDLALEEAGAGTALAYYVDQGVIEITTREIADHDLLTKIYPVEDL